MHRKNPKSFTKGPAPMMNKVGAVKGEVQGNEFRTSGVSTAAPRSSSIHLHPGIVFKLLSGLGKKETLQCLWKQEGCYNHLTQVHNERQSVSAPTRYLQASHTLLDLHL